MVAALADRFREVCRQLVGEDLLVVTVYDRDDIRHEYIVGEVEERSDQIAMDALHRPVLSVHRTLDFVSQLNRIGGGHEGSIHVYEYVTYLHVPVGERSGVIVSLDPDCDRCHEVFSECKALVTERADRS